MYSIVCVSSIRASNCLSAPHSTSQQKSNASEFLDNFFCFIKNLGVSADPAKYSSVESRVGALQAPRGEALRRAL